MKLHPFALVLPVLCSSAAGIELAPRVAGAPEVIHLAAPDLAGAAYAVFAAEGAELSASRWIAAGHLDGAGRAPLPAVPPGVTLQAVIAGARGPVGVTLPPRPPASGAGFLEEPLGDTWDWSWGWGGVAQSAGAVVSDTQPWGFFATLSAVNANPGHPDAAVLVTGGPANELYLAIADSVAAGVGSGPEPAGGTLVIDFPGPTLVNSLTLADVVGAGGEVRSYQGAALADTTPIPDLGGSGEWGIFLSGYGITRLEVEFAGAGLVGGMLLFPHVMALGFDTTTTGEPLGWTAGAEPVQGYPDIGLFSGFIGAVNNAPTHPDLPLLFDSAAPTGGDLDLATPGYGSGNGTAQGLVLIVAENDQDQDADGLVDDPDDELAGGVLSFGFATSNTIFQGVTVIDLDDGGGSFVRVYDDLTGQPTDFPLSDAGDNGVTVFDTDSGIETRNIELHLEGSGALAELRLRHPLP